MNILLHRHTSLVHAKKLYQSLSDDHNSDEILFVSWICAVELCTTSNSDHGKLYYLSFTWFPFGIWVGEHINRALVAC